MALPSGNNPFDDDFLSRLRRLRLLIKRPANAPAPSVHRSVKLGDGLEFADHRLYAPGDDIRFIDWPYYARMEKLLLRMFHRQSEANVAILLDISSSMAGPEKFAYALRASAAMAYVASISLDRVTILPFAEQLTREITIGRNTARFTGALEQLAELEPAGKTNLAECAEEFSTRYRQPSTVLVVSDLMDCDEQMPKALKFLSRTRGEIVFLHVFEPLETNPIFTGCAELIHAETREIMTLEITSQILERYRQGWEEFRTNCERTCLSAKAAYIGASTDKPLEELILIAMRRAAVVA